MGLPLVAEAQGTGGGQVARQTDLAELRREIGRLEERVRQIESREATIENQLERADVELELQEAQLQEAMAARVMATVRLRATETRVVGLVEALESVRVDLRRRLTGLYGLGREGYLRLFLSLEPDVGLLPAIRQLRYLARRDQSVLEDYIATRQELEVEREVLAAQRQEIEEWEAREEERRDRLREYRRVREDLLVKMRREKQAIDAKVTALAKKERKLSRLIATFLGTQANMGGAPIHDFKGVLDWPAQGRVTSEFGPRKDPRYRTEVPHNGLDLSVLPGRPVRAVYSGNVVFADEFEGYGKMVVLLHPGRVFSLYAGLRQLGKQKGGVVSLGEEVGSASQRIYFEIRRENEPEDPREWLR